MSAGRSLFALVLVGMALLAGRSLAAESPGVLSLEQTIALPDCAGRIDHLSLDLARRRLLVAELASGAVEVIDLRASRAFGRIPGLREPQGVAYVAASDRIVVADGGDGRVRIFHAGDLSAAGDVALGKDADDVRVDPRSGHVIVGYGDGGLALIDPAAPARLAEIPLAAHPEAFELDRSGQRIFVNLPDAREIGVVDLEARRQIARWRVPGARSNFPLAINPSRSQLAVVFRRPPRLLLLDARTGTVEATHETCGDADDVFFDARRDRIYVSCGDGAVDAFAGDAAGLHLLQRVATSPGARTSLFVPELDRLFVAAPARASGSNASILVLRPRP